MTAACLTYTNNINRARLAWCRHGVWYESKPRCSFRSSDYRAKFQDLWKYLILWAQCVYAQKKQTTSKNKLIFQGQALETVKGCAKIK